MYKASLLLLAVCAVSPALAQEDVQESSLSAATRNYRRYRLTATEPTYGLAKVKALIKKIKPSGEDDSIAALKDVDWNKLSASEKFTYCMLHGEDVSQNCDIMPWFIDEEKKLFAYPAEFANGEELWSKRQEAFLAKNRPTVIRLMRETIHSQPRVGTNLKAAIYKLRANELIPDVVWAYQRDHKDNDLLTVLNLLMKDGAYGPFVKSSSFHKLYGEDANYQSFLMANSANQKLVMDRAMAYYRSRTGK